VEDVSEQGTSTNTIKGLEEDKIRFVSIPPPVSSRSSVVLTHYARLHRLSDRIVELESRCEQLEKDSKDYEVRFNECVPFPSPPPPPSIP
jgi:hypothetical protein